MNVIAMDPIYEIDSKELEVKCIKDLDLIINELNGVEYLYIWKIFRNKDHLKKQREKAYKAFIKHYKEYNGKYYLAETMPKTKFKDNLFDIGISSHLLFVYDRIFDYNFHKNTIKEMLRICSKEIRIFPLVNLYRQKSRLLKEFLDDAEFQNHSISIERVDYAFIKDGMNF